MSNPSVTSLPSTSPSIPKLSPTSSSSALPKGTKWTARATQKFLSSRTKGAGVWVLDGSVVTLATGRTIAHLRGIEQVKLKEPLQKRSNEAKTSISLPTDTSSQQTNTNSSHTHSATLSVKRNLFYTNTPSGGKMKQFRLRPTVRPRTVQQPTPSIGEVSVNLSSEGRLEMTREGKGGTAQRVVEMIARGDLQGCITGMWQFVGRRALMVGKKQQGGNGSGVVATIEKWDYVDTGKHAIWSWSGVSRCPAWYGSGMCTMYLRGRRVNDGWKETGDVGQWVRQIDVEKEQEKRRELMADSGNRTRSNSSGGNKRRKRWFGFI